MTASDEERIASLECEPWIKLCDSLAEQLDAMSRDILACQTKLLAMEERERRLREALDKTSRLFHDAKHRLFVSGSYNIEVCTALVCIESRDALASPQEPQA